jgi:hypothetical protein
MNFPILQRKPDLVCVVHYIFSWHALVSGNDERLGFDRELDYSPHSIFRQESSRSVTPGIGKSKLHVFGLEINGIKMLPDVAAEQ